jgi:hypothetical protein
MLIDVTILFSFKLFDLCVCAQNIFYLGLCLCKNCLIGCVRPVKTMTFFSSMKDLNAQQKVITKL